MGEKMVAPADFKGPADKRGCTDILCLLLIVAHWVAMTYLGIWACTTGDYRLVLYPMDVDGNICGIDSDVTDSKLRIFVMWLVFVLFPPLLSLLAILHYHTNRVPFLLL